MREDVNEIYDGEGTLKSINIDDYHTVQKNYKIDSFIKCPECENETLNSESRECECGYNLEHKEIKLNEDIINIKKEEIKDIIKDEIKINNIGDSHKLSDYDYIKEREANEKIIFGS